uniref:Putative group i salivary lipocalin n=1 Tax=Rhipicephalus pulchellus TaxID=72859 RepID=L7LQL0_RHIPC
MHLPVLFCVLHLTISLSTVKGNDTDYDYYDTPSETSTTPPKDGNRLTTKKRRNERIKKEEYTDIIQFLNTTEKIWVYYSTERTANICKVDDIGYVYEIGACMTRYYMSSGSIHHNTDAAEFSYHWSAESTRNPYNELMIPRKDVKNTYETLVHQSANNECGVFYVNFHADITDPTAWFELRMRNSSLEKGPDNKCLKTFMDYSHGQKITFNYTSQCQCIFSSQALGGKEPQTPSCDATSSEVN